MTESNPMARGAALASALVAGVLAVLALVWSGGLSSAPAVQGQVRWTAIFALVAVVLSIALALAPVRRARRSAATVAGVIAVVVLGIRTVHLSHSLATIAFLDSRHSALLATLSLTAGAVSLLGVALATAIAPRPDRTRRLRAAGYAGLAMAVVWTLAVGMAVGSAPATPWRSSPTTAAPAESAPLTGIDEVAFRKRLEYDADVYPIEGGFLVDGSPMTAYDGRTGQRRWSFGFDGYPPEPSQKSREVRSITVRDAGREVVVTSGIFTVGLDAVSGRMRWRSAAESAAIPGKDRRNMDERSATWIHDDDQCAALLATAEYTARRVCDTDRIDISGPGGTNRVLTIPSPAGFRFDNMWDAGAGLLVVTSTPSGRQSGDKIVPTSVAVIDGRSGSVIDQFEVSTSRVRMALVGTAHNGLLPVVVQQKRPGSEWGRDVLELRSLRKHQSTSLLLPDEGVVNGTLRGIGVVIGAFAWVEDRLILARVHGLTVVDTGQSNALTYRASPCIGDQESSKITDLVGVPGSLIVRCESGPFGYKLPFDLPFRGELVGLR
ncbi:hypothetical protein [Gordonia sp. FQ]|uniref:hypothetical protein n=1 Tax=Gordonia sp. FQ TaxID=3446634 RepID=UPI003F87F6F6